MFERFLDALTWLLGASGPPLVVLGVLGFAFREKWKQLLTRSMTADLERLKHELALAQQAHAASLSPQLEAMKYDFQKNLEAYKTSLIAQAEEVKLKTDLKKSLGTRYLEIKFDRLMRLEQHIAKAGSLFSYSRSYSTQIRNHQQFDDAVAALRAYGDAYAESEMFLDAEERSALAQFRVKMSEMLTQIGAGPDHKVVPVNSQEGQAFIAERVKLETAIRTKIHLLAGI
jgi:hypothetical protein